MKPEGQDGLGEFRFEESGLKQYGDELLVTQDPETGQENVPDAQPSVRVENQPGPHDILASPATNPFRNGTFCFVLSPPFPDSMLMLMFRQVLMPKLLTSESCIRGESWTKTI